MKAKDLLNWIVKESIEGEKLYLIDVPNEGENEWEQNEKWWLDMFGGLPPSPQPSGEYLCFYASAIEINPNDRYDCEVEPDFQIELCNTGTMYDYDYINFYKIDQ